MRLSAKHSKSNLQRSTCGKLTRQAINEVASAAIYKVVLMLAVHQQA